MPPYSKTFRTCHFCIFANEEILPALREADGIDLVGELHLPVQRYEGNVAVDRRWIVILVDPHVEGRVDARARVHLVHIGQIMAAKNDPEGSLVPPKSCILCLKIGNEMTQIFVWKLGRHRTKG